MKLKKIYQKRLLKLAKFLREEVAPADKLRMDKRVLFYMGNWLTHDDKGHQHTRASIKCGTAACAAGWATAIFPELTFSVAHGHIHMRGKKCTAQLIFGANTNTAYFNHIGEFFGLPAKENENREGKAIYWLFDDHFGRSAEDEADVIEKFVAENS